MVKDKRKKDKKEISQLEFALLKGLLATKHKKQTEVENFVNLENLKTNPEIELPQQHDDSWIDFSTIKKQTPDFKSQISNLPKYLNRLVNKGFIEKKKEGYEDGRRRQHHKNKYRLIKDKKVFVDLFLLFQKKEGCKNTFMKSDYFKDESYIFGKMLRSFGNILEKKDLLPPDRNELIGGCLSNLLYLYHSNKGRFVKMLDKLNYSFDRLGTPPEDRWAFLMLYGSVFMGFLEPHFDTFTKHLDGVVEYISTKKQKQEGG